VPPGLGQISDLTHFIRPDNGGEPVNSYLISLPQLPGPIRIQYHMPLFQLTSGSLDAIFCIYFSGSSFFWKHGNEK
jgi:hypothetical protein